MQNFFYYFVNPNPGSAFNYYTPAIVFIVLLAIGAAAFSIIYKKRKKNDPVFKRMFRLTAGRMFLFAFLFAILLGLRYEAIPYFSMRLWSYITLGFFLYFATVSIKSYHIDYKIEQSNMSRRMEGVKDATKKYVAAKR